MFPPNATNNTDDGGTRQHCPGRIFGAGPSSANGPSSGRRPESGTPMNWENSQILITSARQLLTIIKSLEFQTDVVPLNIYDQALVGLQQDLLRVSRTVTQTWTATELNTIWPVGEWDLWWNRTSSILLQLLDLLAICRRQQKLISAMTFDCQKCLLRTLASTSGLQHLLQAP